MQELNFRLVIITNQSGIARGYFALKQYKVLTSWLLETLFSFGICIEEIKFCPHHPDGKVADFVKIVIVENPNALIEQVFNKDPFSREDMFSLVIKYQM